jgi:hypothetical protein
MKLHELCSGSIAAFLNEKSRILITHGASADGRLLNDSWLLDLDFGYTEQVADPIKRPDIPGIKYFNLCLQCHIYCESILLQEQTASLTASSSPLFSIHSGQIFRIQYKSYWRGDPKHRLSTPCRRDQVAMQQRQAEPSPSLQMPTGGAAAGAVDLRSWHGG